TLIPHTGSRAASPIGEPFGSSSRRVNARHAACSADRHADDACDGGAERIAGVESSRSGRSAAWRNTACNRPAQGRAHGGGGPPAPRGPLGAGGQPLEAWRRRLGAARGTLGAGNGRRPDHQREAAEREALNATAPGRTG